MPDKPRVFLVVVDESDEMKVALRYACRRAKNTGGHVALFRSIEPLEFQHWAGVGELMREEAREEAEELLSNLSQQVVEMSGQIPIVYVREGTAREELVKLIDEEPSISILVLAASASGEGPGPLVTYMAGKGSTRMRVPITIVPGNLSDNQIDLVT